MRSRALVPVALVAALLLAPVSPAVAAAPPTISGTVHLGSGTRAGLPVAWFSPGSTSITSTTTDAEGRYSLTAPPSGTRYIVAVNVRGLLSKPHAAVASHLAVYVGDGPDVAPAAPLVDPAIATGRDRTMDVVVPAASVVRGAHASFAARQVRLVTLGGREAGTTTADAHGGWSFRVAPGRYRIEVPGTVRWLDYRSKAFTVPAGGTLVKRSAPVRSGTIAGRLTWHGQAAAKVRVWLHGPSRTADPDDDPVRTDAHGRFRFPGLLPGRFVVRFGNTGGADRNRYVPGSRSVTVRSGRTTAADAALVRGAIVDGRFDPADAARSYTVQARWGDATGPLERSFSVHASAGTARNPVQLFGLRTGTWTVQVVDAVGTRYASRTLHLRAGTRTDVGTLRPTRTALTISGHAPAGASVHTGEGALRRQVVAGSDGAYALAGLVPGRYEVQAQLQGYSPASVRRTIRVSTTVDLPAGTRTVLQAGTVAGRLTVGALDLPLGQVTIDGGQSLIVQEGLLDATGIDAGPHRITGVGVLGDALFPARTPYDLAWPVADREFTVPDGGTVDLGTVALDVVG